MLLHLFKTGRGGVAMASIIKRGCFLFFLMNILVFAGFLVFPSDRPKLGCLVFLVFFIHTTLLMLGEFRYCLWSKSARFLSFRRRKPSALQESVEKKRKNEIPLRNDRVWPKKCGEPIEIFSRVVARKFLSPLLPVAQPAKIIRFFHWNSHHHNRNCHETFPKSADGARCFRGLRVPLMGLRLNYPSFAKREQLFSMNQGDFVGPAALSDKSRIFFGLFFLISVLVPRFGA